MRNSSHDENNFRCERNRMHELERGETESGGRGKEIRERERERERKRERIYSLFIFF